jgi:hypothetical protein
MKRTNDLEQRLVDWGKEYGGGKYAAAGGGGSPLASMMKWRGRPPTGLGYESSNTSADEVHAAVHALAIQSQGWLPAEVLRCEYWLPGQPIHSKLQKLRAVGNNLSRVRYYQHLRIARVHVAGWLHLPFCDDEEEIIHEMIREIVLE